MYRMVFPYLVGLNFRLFSLWQDRLLSPCSVLGHSVVSYIPSAWVALCVCVCLFGWSSSVRVFLFGRWWRLVGRKERAYRSLKGACDWCVCAKFGWLGVGFAFK
jgi:hypothetical protein